MSDHEFDAAIMDSTMRVELLRVVHATEYRRLEEYAVSLAEAAGAWLAIHDEGMKSREAAARLYASGAIPAAAEVLRAALAKNPDATTTAGTQPGESGRYTSGTSGGPMAAGPLPQEWSAALREQLTAIANCAYSDIQKAVRLYGPEVGFMAMVAAAVRRSADAALISGPIVPLTVQQRINEQIHLEDAAAGRDDPQRRGT